MQEDYTFNSIRTNNIRKILVTGLLVLLSVFFLVWMYNNSFINIIVSNASQGDVNYKIIDQKSGKTVYSESKPGNLKQRVPRGNYEVLITQNETSYYKSVDSGSFLTTTTIKASLQAEKARSYVGNFPSECAYYDQEMLYSYGCEGNDPLLKIHQPATSEEPPTASIIDEALSGLTVDNMIRAADKNIVLLGGRLFEDESKASVRIAELKADFSLKDVVVPAGVTDDRLYKILSYKEGFVLYNAELTDVLYYSSLNAEPQKITFEKPKDEKLLPFELIAKEDKLTAIYSYAYDKKNFKDGKTSNEDTVNIKTGNTVFQVLQNDKIKSFTLKGGYVSANLCGQNNLCVLNGATLKVYDISGKKQKELFAVNDVRDIFNDGDKLVMLRANEVLSMDIESRSGQIGYSFGEYVSCGAESVPTGGYLLCIGGSEASKSTLYVDTKQDNAGSIDKKVASIEDQPYIDTVSIYKNFIYIVPDLGEPIYDPAIKGYFADPAVRQKTNADINEFIDEIGIDRKQYTVINTQP